MDFFETRERYRRREMRSYISLLLRVFVVGGVLWVGWLWGHAETGSLRAEAERTLYENNQQISDLSTDVQRLEMELAEARAKNKVDELARDNDADLKALVTKKIARGVAPSQIMQAIQKLGQPTNCRSLETLNVAVATRFMAGLNQRRACSMVDLNLHVEGQAGGKSARERAEFRSEAAADGTHGFSERSEGGLGDVAVSCDDPHRRVGAASRFQRSPPAWLCFGFDIQLHPAVAPGHAWPGRDA